MPAANKKQPEHFKPPRNREKLAKPPVAQCRSTGTFRASPCQRGKRGKRIAQSSSRGRKEPEEGEKIAERKATRTAGRPAKEQKKHRDASKAMEFREHVTATKTKERRRDSTLGVMREALAQLDRRQRGKLLNREQRQLADLGETLSPARGYGYGAGNAGRASSTEEQSGSDGSGSGSDFSSDDEILRFSDGDSEASGRVREQIVQVSFPMYWAAAAVANAAAAVCLHSRLCDDECSGCGVPAQQAV